MRVATRATTPAIKERAIGARSRRTKNRPILAIASGADRGQEQRGRELVNAAGREPGAVPQAGGAGVHARGAGHVGQVAEREHDPGDGQHDQQRGDDPGRDPSRAQPDSFLRHVRERMRYGRVSDFPSGRSGTSQERSVCTRAGRARPRVRDGDDGYADPETGLFVFTAGYLSARGTCCDSDCRHCPYPK